MQELLPAAPSYKLTGLGHHVQVGRVAHELWIVISMWRVISLVFPMVWTMLHLQAERCDDSMVWTMCLSMLVSMVHLCLLGRLSLDTCPSRPGKS
jgi:hypothetical protein